MNRVKVVPFNFYSPPKFPSPLFQKVYSKKGLVPSLQGMVLLDLLCTLWHCVHDKPASVKFLKQRNLLHNPRICVNSHPMVLQLRDNGDRWRCNRRNCRMRKNTWLEGSIIYYQDIVLFMYSLSCEMTSVKFVEHEHELVLGSLFTRRKNHQGRVLTQQFGLWGYLSRNLGMLFVHSARPKRRHIASNHSKFYSSWYNGSLLFVAGLRRNSRNGFFRSLDSEPFVKLCWTHKHWVSYPEHWTLLEIS